MSIHAVPVDLTESEYNRICAFFKTLLISPTADTVESANLQPPTNAAQNAKSSASGDPAAAGA